MYIYCTINKRTGKKYVGKCTRTPENSTDYYGSGILLKQQIYNLGKENFEKQILEEGIVEENLNDRERYWIQHLGTKSPSGYNLTDGGDGVKKLSEESRKRQVEKLKQLTGPLNSRYGRKNTVQHLEAIRKANLGKLTKPETIEKLRQANLGKKLKPETIEKLSKAKLGHTTSEETRKAIGINQPSAIQVNQVDKKSGEVLSTYYSLREASRQTGVKVESISMCLAGRTKSAGGFNWIKL
jgi:group I intron endonuclease